MKYEIKNGENSTTDKLEEKCLNPNLIFENKIVPEYVPTKLAASYLGISEGALRIRVCRGQIRAHKFGRSLRFRLPELANLFQTKEVSNGN